MPFLSRLGLHRRELRAWAMYDWANSAFATTVITAVFPLFFAGYACAGAPADVANDRLAFGTGIALALIAVLSPILGAVADRAPYKKRMLAIFTTMGVTITVLLATITSGGWWWAIVLFGLGNIAANGAFVFYDSLLPHIAQPDELDRVSTAGYALGYVGGGVLLVVNAMMLQHPDWFALADKTQAAKACFITVAAWWAIFSIPVFRRVPEPHADDRPRPRGFAIVPAAFAELGETFRELRRYRQALVLLVAFLVYNDGIGTIQRMAVAYGASLHLPTGALITALIIAQFVGIPATFGFGWLAGVIGTRRALFVGLATFVVVSILGYYMTTATEFYALAGLVGLVQGGTQALSRSLFASMIPKAKSSEFFGLFGVSEKFAGIFGPVIFGAITAFGSSRMAILSVVGFFVLGAILLALVNVEEGQRAVAPEPEPEPQP